MKQKTIFFNNSLLSYALLVWGYKARLLSLGLCGILMLGGGTLFAQNCSVNGGASGIVICDTIGTLMGTITSGSSTVAGASSWSFVSGPTTPTIVSPNSLTTSVTGMTAPGTYTFRISLPCSDGDTATQDIIRRVYPRPTNFRAEAGTSGLLSPVFLGDSVTCGGSHKITDASPLPSGYTATWEAFRYQAPNFVPATNLQIDNPTTDTPTVTMINAANTTRTTFRLVYTVRDPTDTCTYIDSRFVSFCPSISNVRFRGIDECNARGLPLAGGSSAYPFRSASLRLIINSGPDSNLIFTGATPTAALLSNATIDSLYVVSLVITNACCSEVDTLGPYNFRDRGPGPRRRLIFDGDPYVCVKNGIPDSVTGRVIMPDDPNGRLRIQSISPSVGVTGRVIPAPGDTIKPFVLYYDSILITNPPLVSERLIEFRAVGENGCESRAFLRVNFVDDSVDRNTPDVVSCDFNPSNGRYSAQVNFPPNRLGPRATIRNIEAPLGVSLLPPRMTLTNATTLFVQTPGRYVYTVTQQDITSDLAQAYFDCADNGYRGIDTFEVVYFENPGANAGTDQVLNCTNFSELVGNSVTNARYRWRLLTKPASASDPIMTTPDSSSTILSGINGVGVYTYEYTTSYIDSTVLNCISTDTVALMVPRLTPSFTAMVTSDEVCPGGTGSIVAGITAANGTMPPYIYTLYSLDSSQVYTNMTGSFTGLTHGGYVVSATTSDTMCMTAPVFLTIGDSLAVTPYLILTGVDSCSGNTYSASYITDGDTVLANGRLVTGGVITGIPTNMPLEVTAYTTDRGCSVTSVIPAPGPCPVSCVNPVITAGQGVCDSVGSGTYSVAYSVNPAGALLTVNGVARNTSGVAQASLGDSVVIEATVGSCVSRVVIASPANCNNPCMNPFISVGGAQCISSVAYSVPYSATMGAVVTASAGTPTGNSVTNIPVGTPVTIGVSLPPCPDPQQVTIASPDCSNLDQSSVMLADPCDCNDSLNIIVDGVYYFHEAITISGFQVVPDSILLGMTSNIYLRTGNSISVYDPLDSVAFDMVSPGIFRLDLWVPSNIQGSGNVIFFSNGVSQIRQIPSNLLASCNRRHCITIPTLGEWGLSILGLLLLIVGVVSYGHYWAVQGDKMLNDGGSEEDKA